MDPKRAWQHILDAGSAFASSPTERRCIRLTNQMSVLASVITLARAGLDPLSLAHAEFRLITVISLPLYLVVPLLMASGRVVLAQFWFAGFATAGLAAQAAVVGAVGQGHLLFLTVTLGAWLVVTPARIWLAVFFTLVPLLVFLWFELVNPPGLVPVSPRDVAAAAHSNHLVVVLLVLGFAFYAFQNTHRAESALALALRRSDDLLLNMLPSPIAERLKQHPGAIAQRFDHATILFADIVGFTTLAERTEPADLVVLLDTVFTRFDVLAERHGLEKIKTIGDAYMVAAGIPSPRVDHVETMARMALDMQRALTGLPGEPAALEVRIGIHTGPVVAGVIGRKRLAYDLWGDSVNTASRLESHGQPGRIHVSSEVHRALRNRFEFEDRGIVAIKGKGELHTWFLTGEKTRG